MTVGLCVSKALSLTIVVPCFNEEEALPHTNAALLTKLRGLIASGRISATSRICYVDDGSYDATWSVIQRLTRESESVEGLKLARNVGHQNALLAGLFSAPGDLIITIDADLQDDVEAIDMMLSEQAKGSDVVYGVRDQRKQDTFFKRVTARVFYRIMTLLGAPTIADHADFRLMTRKAIEHLRQFDERNVFLRGLVPLIGGKSAVVYYARSERVAGESKYPLGKMLAFAFDGVTSFSTMPMRVISFMGGLVFLATILFGFWVVFVKLFTDDAVPGWASTVLPLYMLGGVQILCIGLLGEYVGKIYRETKGRPRYFIEEKTF